MSAGCKFCYAEIMTRRLKAMGQEKYAAGFKTVRCHPEELKRPATWKKPSIVFVNSMSDMFHPEVPLNFIQQVFSVMSSFPQHTFQVLTKRAERLAKVESLLEWGNNIWMGVSVEDSKVIDRIEFLKRTSANIKFLSLEPLLGPLPKLDLIGIDWVIVGGESGFRPRPIEASWVTDIRDQCEAKGVAFFFKQWGGKNKKLSGRILDGRTYDGMPQTSGSLDITSM